MAILDKGKNNFIVDRDESRYIGFKLPMLLDNGHNALTNTTIDAIKQNLLNILNTGMGERVMQPTLGFGLRKFLFEQLNEDTIIQIQDTIVENIGYWMPFVQINDILVNMSTGVESTLEVSINFSLKKDPQIAESIQINIGE